MNSDFHQESLTPFTSGAFNLIGVIWIRISDPRSVWNMAIKGTDESTLVMDSSVSLMHHDPDRSWIQITLIKERNLSVTRSKTFSTDRESIESINETDLTVIVR